MGPIVHEVIMSKTWVPVAFVIGGLLFIASGLVTEDMPMVARLAMIFSGILFFLVAPDMRAVYGLDGILLTFGPGKIWKVRIRREDIKRITIVEFNALKDFGGWGIKTGRGKFKGVLMWAWISTRSRGILLETEKGKKYLIGDEDPEDTLTHLAGMYPVEIE